jgi:hypothetical protein
MRILIFLLLSLTGYGQLTQDTTDQRLLKYDTAIVIPLPAKHGIERQARFVGFSYNLETQQLHILWRVTYNGLEFYGKDSELKYQIADNQTFVNMQGEIIDTTGHAGPFMTEFDFYKLIAQRGTGVQNATINQLIIQAGMRPGKWKE